MVSKQLFQKYYNHYSCSVYKVAAISLGRLLISLCISQEWINQRVDILSNAYCHVQALLVCMQASEFYTEYF